MDAPIFEVEKENHLSAGCPSSACECTSSCVSCVLYAHVLGARLLGGRTATDRQSRDRSGDEFDEDDQTSHADFVYIRPIAKRLYTHHEDEEEERSEDEEEE